MKKNILNPLATLSLGLCVLFSFTTYQARGQATTQGWDPNGTTSIGGSGFTWDTTSSFWTPAGTETQVDSSLLVPFTAGNVALFCAGPSASVSQGLFTNSVSGIVGIGGIVLGNDNPGASSMTLNGPGTLLLSSATTPFSVGGTGGSSNIINCTIDGPSGNQLVIENSSASTTSLFGTNTYAGGTSIDGSGAINFNNSNSFGTGTITWAVGGFLQASGSSPINISNAMTHLASAIETFSGSTAGVTFSGPWALPATGYGEIENISHAITIAGPISGSVGFTITNKGGTFTLTGTNTFTGTLTNAGTLTIGGAGSLGSGNYAGTILNRTNLIYASSASQTLGGIISSTGGLLQQGPGVLTLSAVNSYTGNTSISPGTTLVVGGAGSLGGTYAHNITNNGTFVLDSTAGSTLSGVISGSGLLVQEGTSSWTLSGLNNTSTGLIVISNGTLAFNGDGALGAVPASLITNYITLNGGSNAALRVNSNNIVINPNRGIYLDMTGGQIQVAGSDTCTNGAVISGPGNFQFGANISTGLGTMLFTGSNTYAGTTTIACGTMRLGTNGALPSGTPLLIEGANSPGSVLDLNTYSQTIGALTSGTGFNGVGTANPAILLTGALTILESSNTSFSGIISGAGGSLTLSGTSTLTLNDTNTYTGSTIISSGTLALGATGSISNSASISLAAGATLDTSAISAFGLSTTNSLVASGTATPATINGASGGTVSFGSQPITLNYDGTHPALLISQGSLVLNGNAFIVNGSPISSGTNTLISQASGIVNGTGPFTVSGTAIGAATNASIVVSGGNVNLVFGSGAIVGAPGSFTGVALQPDHSILLNFTGTPGAGYIIQGTTNLHPPAVWTALNTNTAGTNGVIQYDDETSTNFATRYYRMLATP